MLLRVLQSGEFIKVGSSKVEKTDVRVVAATNLNLRTQVEKGLFREDLYYRLNAVQILMPALRERKEDIYLLFRKFTSDFSEKYRLCKISLNLDAISLLKNYRWPGNIRQLKNVAETITALESRPITPGSEKIELGADQIRRYIPDERDTLLPSVAVSSNGGSSLSDEDKRMIVKALLDMKQEVDSLRKEVSDLKNGSSAPLPVPPPPAPEQEEAEWQEQNEEQLSIKKATGDMIERALEKHGGNVKAAAEELGISERTVYRKIADKKKKK